MNVQMKNAAEAGQILSRQVRGDAILQKSQDLGQKEGKLQEVSQEFESLFVEILLNSMRQSVQKSGLMDGGNAEDIYQSMLDSEYAKIIAKQDKTGLSAMIEKQLLQIMDAQPAAGQPPPALLQQGRKAYGVTGK